jgi:hypothetical protein
VKQGFKSLCDSSTRACLGCRNFILHACYSWSLAPRWLEVALELPLNVVNQGKFVLPIFVIGVAQDCFCDILREERVERDPILCEPFNEDVGFFVNPNLGIKSYVSCVLLLLLAL